MELNVGVEFGCGESKVLGCGKPDAAARECGREAGNQEHRGGSSLECLHLSMRQWLKELGLFCPPKIKAWGGWKCWLF